jgi:hypothetical protein
VVDESEYAEYFVYEEGEVLLVFDIYHEVEGVGGTALVGSDAHGCAGEEADVLDGCWEVGCNGEGDEEVEVGMCEVVNELPGGYVAPVEVSAGDEVTGAGYFGVFGVYISEKFYFFALFGEFVLELEDGLLVLGLGSIE